MENASKALIMAGGVLIGIVLLTLLVFAFRSGGQFASNTDDAIAQASINAFNSKFNIYAGRTDITWHDILTVVSLAQNINSKNSYKVDVGFVSKGSSMETQNNYRSYIDPLYRLVESTGTTQDMVKESIVEKLKSEDKYTCLGVEYNMGNGRINKIIFMPN